jgi:predicted metal-dependent peptidase
MTFENLTLTQRVQAANIDCMRHPKFALLSGVICMGKSEVKEDVPTAMTDGKNKYYGAEFIKPLNRKQLRYLVLHENFHVALKHCLLFKEWNKRAPRLCNIAQDFVVNSLIEELDPEFKFVERPTESLCIDEKYKGWSFPQVFNDLVKDAEVIEVYEPLDEHAADDGEGEPRDADAEDKLGKQIDDANRQGEMIARKLAGKEGGGRDIFGLAKERMTNWRDPLQDFIQTVCAGDENSRFCPPNKRLLASGFVMPSHFSETVGELVIACDTSGSMTSYYPIVFGEVARICQHVKPEKVRMLWWDTSVCGDQEFKPDQYDQIASLMKPKGGGGTTPDVVVQYISKHKIDAKAIVWLSDGYLGCQDPVTPMPSLWGIVDNDDFVAAHGKTLHISV